MSKNGKFTVRFSPRLNSGVASEPRPSTVAISKQLGAKNLFVDSPLALFYRNSAIVMLCKVIPFVAHQRYTPPREVHSNFDMQKELEKYEFFSQETNLRKDLMKYRMGSKTKEIRGINALVLVTNLKKHKGKTPLCWLKTTALIQP